MKDGEATLIKIEHHRNGMAGVPFYVAIFDIRGEDGKAQRLVGIKFDNTEEIFTAALDIQKLAAGDIEFGSNSFRGEIINEYMTQWVTACDSGTLETETDKFLKAAGFPV